MTSKPILKGLKVVEFSFGIAATWVGEYLAEFGAEVIKVESTKRLDVTRMMVPYKDGIPGVDRAVFFVHCNMGKYSMTLDLTHARGSETARKLVSWADVILENFRPGVMKKLGLDYEELKKIKPDIIMASCSIMGDKGPLAGVGGFGNAAGALSGIHYLTGWPDREPVMPGIAVSDLYQHSISTMAVLAALDYKRRTGKGQFIDASQVEAVAHFITRALLDHQVGTHSEARMGNRDAYASPHGVFRCKGDDKWCAIAVFTDEEWKGFCQAIGNPPWTKETRFSSLASRKANEDELERLVESWTIDYSPDEVMGRMQKSGVPAGVVQDAADIVDRDPQLKARCAFLPIAHPVIGVCAHPAPPIKLSKSPAEIRTAPCLGQHTEYVCTRILGMSDPEFMELLESGALV